MPSYLLVPCRCGRSVRVAAKDAGSVVRCWDCGSEVTISHPPNVADLLQGFELATRAVFQPGTLATVFALAAATTVVMIVPYAGVWLAFGVLAAAAWWYQRQIRESGVVVTGGADDEETDPGGWGRRSAWLALAVLGAAAVVAPFLVRNGGRALPPRVWVPGYSRLMVPAMLGWLIVPLVLAVANARDRGGPIAARRAGIALARHPAATLTALLVVPVGAFLVEFLLALVVWQQGLLPLLVDDLIVAPHDELRRDATYRLYRFQDLVFSYPTGDHFAEIFPVYLAGLRRGLTLLGTIPPSLSNGLTSRAPFYMYRTGQELYLALRVVMSILSLSLIGVLLALQARWLGLIAPLGARVGAAPPPRPRAEPSTPAPAATRPVVHALPASPIPVVESHRVVPDPWQTAVTPPAAFPEHRNPVALNGPFPGSPGRGLPVVLVIDDERPFAEALGRLLEGRGFSVVHAPDAATGLQFARTGRPDLILLDLMLPDLPGLEVCRVLRAANETRSIPVVITTYKSGAEDEVAGLDAGADDFVIKPYVIDVLVARIRRQLRRVTV